MSRCRVACLGRAKGGSAAIEFALVYPVLFLLLAGSFELTRAVNSARRITTVASSIATMIASDAKGSISSTDLHYAFDSAMITFPDVLADSAAKGIAWSSDISISMAGVVFTPTVPGCKSQCTYKANIVWTGGAATRSCGSTLTSMSDTDTATPTTLPSNLYTPIAIPAGGFNPPPFAVVVDVAYTWTPAVFSRQFGTATIRRSAYLTSRYASKINYTKLSDDDAFGKQCPGY